jgi:hypothetical protein
VPLVPTYVGRPAFRPLHRRTQRWAIAVAHRRAGKTVACVNELIEQARRCPRDNPRYAYIAPQLNQAKDIAWHYLKQFSHYLGCVRANESELWIEFPRVRPDGSDAGSARVRIYGADNPDRLRGLYLDGAVLDEFGDMDPTHRAKLFSTLSAHLFRCRPESFQQRPFSGLTSTGRKSAAVALRLSSTTGSMRCLILGRAIDV